MSTIFFIKTNSILVALEQIKLKTMEEISKLLAYTKSVDGYSALSAEYQKWSNYSRYHFDRINTPNLYIAGNLHIVVDG